MKKKTELKFYERPRQEVVELTVMNQLLAGSDGMSSFSGDPTEEDME